jgi:hypothetical protein
VPCCHSSSAQPRPRNPPANHKFHDCLFHGIDRLVIVGDLIGSREVQDIVGVTPNLAARLQTIAEPNTVVIDDSTRKTSW